MGTWHGAFLLLGSCRGADFMAKKKTMFLKIIEAHGESKASEKNKPTLVKEEMPKPLECCVTHDRWT